MSAEPLCKSCTSSNLIELITETCLLFPGLTGLKTEPMFVFPKIIVCTDCGFVQSRLSDRQLEKVKKGAATVKTASL